MRSRWLPRLIESLLLRGASRSRLSHLGEHPLAQALRRTKVHERESVAVAVERLVVAPQVLKQDGLVVPRPRVARIKGEHLVVGGKRLVRALHIHEQSGDVAA